MKTALVDDFEWCRNRLLALHSEAKSGHIGGDFSCLPGLCTVFSRLRTVDRFVLSKGHSAGALYVVLARHGQLPEAELRNFRKDGGRLPGHPPANVYPAIPFATGSLGHGLSLAAGFALSQRLRGADENTYCLTSDGEWQEGSTWEALIFATHRRLSNLTVLVDHNGWQAFGRTADVASMDPLWERLVGFDVDTVVVNGRDLEAISTALAVAPSCRPRIIFLRTVKGDGVPGMEDTLESHYLPLTNEQYEQAIGGGE